MAEIRIFHVRDIGNGQLACTVVVPDASWAGEAAVGEHENFVVDAGDRFGLGPLVRALIGAGVYEGEIAPLVTE